NSFVSVKKEQLERAVAALTGQTIGGRAVPAEPAKKGPKSGPERAARTWDRGRETPHPWLKAGPPVEPARDRRLDCTPMSASASARAAQSVQVIVGSQTLRQVLDQRRTQGSRLSLDEAISVIVPLCLDLKQRHDKGERVYVHPSCVAAGAD